MLAYPGVEEVDCIAGEQIPPLVNVEIYFLV